MILREVHELRADDLPRQITRTRIGRVLVDGDGQATAAEAEPSMFDDVDALLETLMDQVVALSRADKGFLLLMDDGLGRPGSARCRIFWSWSCP